MTAGFEFRREEQGPEGHARCGRLVTPHGEVPTPVFMPVGTAASVKGLPQQLLEQLDARIVLANTYHLYLRPGPEVVRRLGGLHGFMSWDRAVLTDSGGYQVFSHRELRTIREEGVEFRSHLDGSRHFLTPEKAVEIQQALGADVIMALDECTPYPVSREEARSSMLRSMRWAQRCRAVPAAPGQALFGIVQGSVDEELRRESLERILDMGFEGVALGGFSVGEPRERMFELLEALAGALPSRQPRYLMGVGTPLDLVRAVRQGIDMFDCVLPTRNARNGTLFTSRGVLRIKNARYREDGRPLDESCRCLACSRYSRAYLRHLYVANEMAAGVLMTFHNLQYYLDLMRRVRGAVGEGRMAELERELREVYPVSPG